MNGRAENGASFAAQLLCAGPFANLAVVRFLLLLGLLYSSCGDDAPPSDDAGEENAGPSEARLELGTGVTGFVAIEDGADVELVNGPQGGWHVDVAMRIHGLDPQDLVMRIEGYDVASGASIGIPIQRVLAESRVQREGDHWLRVGDQLIFAISEPSEVVGTDVRIQARLTSPEGDRAEAQKVVHVVDLVR